MVTLQQNKELFMTHVPSKYLCTILWIAFGWWHNNAFLSSLLAWVLHIVTCTWVLTWPHYSFLPTYMPLPSLLWVVTFIASRVLAIMDLVKPFLSFLLCWSLQDDLPTTTYILYLRMQVSRALDIVQKGMYVYIVLHRKTFQLHICSMYYRVCQCAKSLQIMSAHP